MRPILDPWTKQVLLWLATWWLAHECITQTRWGHMIFEMGWKFCPEAWVCLCVPWCFWHNLNVYVSCWLKHAQSMNHIPRLLCKWSSRILTKSRLMCEQKSLCRRLSDINHHALRGGGALKHTKRSCAQPSPTDKHVAFNFPKETLCIQYSERNLQPDSVGDSKWRN